MVTRFLLDLNRTLSITIGVGDTFMISRWLTLAACCAAVVWGLNSPFYCDLKALTTEQRARYEELSKTLLGSVEEKRELRNGYAFRLNASVPMTVAAEWAELESKCCPFFGFQIERERERGALWLRLTGRDGVKQFIRSEFGL
jgi:hypothetical protein